MHVYVCTYTCRVCAQSCPTLCGPTDCSPPSSLVHGVFPGKNTRVELPFPSPGDLPDPYVYVYIPYTIGLRFLQRICLPTRRHGFNSRLGRSLGDRMATHSSILAWEIPWTEEPGGQQSMGRQKSQTQLSD